MDRSQAEAPAARQGLEQVEADPASESVDVRQPDAGPLRADVPVSAVQAKNPAKETEADDGATSLESGEVFTSQRSQVYVDSQTLEKLSQAQSGNKQTNPKIQGKQVPSGPRATARKLKSRQRIANGTRF
jgi:hypothetical protein